jgi:hypothetical protein
VTLPLPSAAGKRAVRVRFHYIGNSAFYWAVDDVVVGAPSCVAQHGGLLAGAITDRVSDAPVDGAQVNLSGAAELPAWPAGVAQATGDPALPGGYYWLFVPSGHQHLVVSATGYDTATTTVDVAADRISRHDVALTAHGS